jgi:hypothetical protein
MERAHKDMAMARLREFWLGWRKEIVRGGLIFMAVVVIGLVMTRMFGWIPMGIAQGFDNFSNWDFDRGSSGRQWEESYRWVGPIKASHWVWIRNTNGPVVVEASESESLVVEVDKSARHSNPDDVEIRVVEHDGTATFCAVWHAAVMECGPEGAYRVKDQKKSDVAVRFRVLLPKGIKLNASTVNGPVDVSGAQGAVALATVNGRIHAVAQGPVRATTVNGSIHATMESLGGDDAVELKTVNGSIEAELPARLDAELDASTVSGRVSTELPIQLIGRVSPRSVKARIGNGGRRLVLSTVNGSIAITEAATEPH